MSDDQLLTIDVVDRGADVVVAVSGELDFGTTPELLEVAEPFAAEGRQLILDLAEVPFCDSSGLGALVRLHRVAQAAGGGLTVARLTSQVEAAVTVTMLHRALAVRDRVPEPGEAQAP